MPKRVRLLSVDLQARFVVDDGETMEELVGQPVHLTAQEWAGYPERFEADRLAHEQALNS